ncbi:M13-type metalloendopeptidase [Lysinibacter sp. HNR]|uniref:M13 family metallopeptidase n=1 Tax=Lysinibacter sp. HNR TaxID=3031408 RepID=UPI002435806E|nr:M13-type metalloendopeptidase [Lysinibacter sp. HNR]WGD37400.1 M13-type metalloendopeptidase [Lysinibacter sp. HNR]
MTQDTSPTHEAALPSGITLTELDASVRPQDDLFRHVNGKWIDRTQIPSDKARYGAFHVLAEDAEKAVRDIITEAQRAEPGTERRKIGDLYASFMDVSRREELGIGPIVNDLEAARAVTNVSDLVGLIARLERGGMSGFLGMGIDNDPGNPERYIVFVVQSGIGLPDEAYYREEKFAEIREAYRAHIERMLTLGGVPGAAEAAASVYDLETRIAAVHWDKVANRDVQKLYNLRTFAELQELTPALDWNLYLAEMGIPHDALSEVVAEQLSALTGITDLLTEENLPAWRSWLLWQIIRSSAAYLTEEISRANFDFYGTALTGTPQQRELWKRAVAFTEGAMGEAIGKIYVERHFDERSKKAMDALVNNLIEAYRNSITHLEWMGFDTRLHALDKLNKFTPKVGYPVKWRDYSTLEVDATDLVGNARRVTEVEFRRELGKIGSPIDRDEWFMTPQTINAYYNPGFNEIVFPAAILQEPFFSADRDAAANYGAIGAVIGHEIGHGFDDQGSRYDGDGKLVDWWTEHDRAAFEERTRSLIDQYSALAPRQVPENFVNGELTIGENIGDLGGLAIAWDAYVLSLGGAEAPVIDGLTAAQRFFLSWAQAWQQKGRDEEIIRLLTTDPHSPSEFRCNQIVRNIDGFYEAFDVKEGDQLWLDPAERVTIW